MKRIHFSNASRLPISDLVVLAIVSLVFLPACRQSGTPTGNAQEVRITAILPLTGPSADLGQSVANGMRLAEEDMNRADSAVGRRFSLNIDDSKGAPAEAVTVYRAAMTQNHPNVVLSWMSSVGSALAPLASADSVTLFVGAALSRLVNESARVIRVWPRDTHIGEAMGDFAAQQRFGRVAILYIDDEYGRAVADAFRRVVEAKGVEVVAEEPLGLRQTDFRVTLERIRSVRPSAIYMPAYGGVYTHGLKQIREVLGDITIMADLPLLSSFTLPQLGDEVEGVIVPATALDVRPFATEEAGRFAERYRARFNREVDFNVGLGYMMFAMAARGVAASDGSGAGVARYVSMTKSFDGPLGTITYDAQNDSDIPLQIARIENRQPQALTPLRRREEANGPPVPRAADR